MKLIRSFLWLPLFFALSASAAESVSSANGWRFDAQLIRGVMWDLATSQAQALLGATIKWAIAGALFGLLLAIGGIMAGRSLGWYESGWKHARWIRWPLWIGMVTACMLLVGVAGFWKGVVQGSETVLLKSQLGTRVFPAIAGTLADGVAGLQVLAERKSEGQGTEDLVERLNKFREGAWEVNATRFANQLDLLRSETISNVVASIERGAVTHAPLLQDPLANQLLQQGLHVFRSVLVENKVTSEMKRLGADRLYIVFREKLVSEARRKGNPESISHAELSSFIVTDVLVPQIMKPLRSFARGQELIFFLLAVCCAGLPALLFRFTCGRIRARTIEAAASAEGPSQKC